ncbi:DNA-binding protein [uncultured Paraburkholderia sp.]|nr:DNA-binding protein [uncultured Paraburkholderia sp.]
MLAEAGDAAPASGTRFRQIVSVRKLRARLGAGDLATLARVLNAIETEVVRVGLADIAIPDLPSDVADLMRALWQAAVAVQLDDVSPPARSVAAGRGQIGLCESTPFTLIHHDGQICALNPESRGRRAYPFVSHNFLLIFTHNLM